MNWRSWSGLDLMDKREIEYNFKNSVKECDVCEMRIGEGKSHLQCVLCGMGIHGKPRTVHEGDRLLRFCCNKCRFSYLDASW